MNDHQLAKIPHPNSPLYWKKIFKKIYVDHITNTRPMTYHNKRFGTISGVCKTGYDYSFQFIESKNRISRLKAHSPPYRYTPPPTHTHTHPYFITSSH